MRTRRKILLASLLSSLVCRLRAIAGKGPKTIIERRGVRWSVDLGEGIDFSIFLVGAFELRTMRAYWPLIRPGDVILDIGANVGAHTLMFAKRTGDGGKVIAFEPTRYAYSKLAKNVSLNPWAVSRVVIEQAMLVAAGGVSVVTQIPASWPLGFGRSVERHADHGGVSMATDGARVVTLDDYVDEAEISKVDFVKLDVDGNEWQVVEGGLRVLARDRPVVLIEIAPHGYDQTIEVFDRMLARFASLGYRLENTSARQTFPLEGPALRRAIPDGSSRNMFLFPKDRGIVPRSQS